MRIYLIKFFRIRAVVVFVFSFFNLFSQINLPTFQAINKPNNQNVFQGVSATFTNCGKTYRDGPSQANCDASYSGSNLTGFVTVTGGIQYFTIPATRTYTIEVFGAQGGRKPGGLHTKGARMKGDFTLTAGTVLKILVGQAGTWGPDIGASSCSNLNAAGSGGGGSFVAKQDNTPLIVAGGGGGYNMDMNSTLTNAVITLDGVFPNIDGRNVAGRGGINGGGGGAGLNGTAGTQSTNGGNGSSCSYGPGGAGFYTNGGGNCNDDIDAAGRSFLNGGQGGNSIQGCRTVHGGFGGGASAGHRSGGGGGWSGGGGGAYTGGGGGGASYNSGTNQDNSAGVREGHGQVIISW